MEEFENFLFSPEFNPSGTVLISSQNQLPTMQSDPSKEIKLLRYDPTTVTFETKTQTPQLLYLSDADDGNWRASVDGMTSPIIRANWAFRAVLVPTGMHRVEFWYFPKSFSAGIVLTVASFLVIAATLMYGRKRKSLDRKGRS